jgi:hypothetical protein
MGNKNTICLWYDGTALDAARFYAETFPDSAVGAVMRAPGDYPAGKEGDVLTVEFTVIADPLRRAQRRAGVQAQRGVLFPDRARRPGRNRPLVERDRRKRRRGKRVRLVQRQAGPPRGRSRRAPSSPRSATPIAPRLISCPNVDPPGGKRNDVQASSAITGA